MTEEESKILQNLNDLASSHEKDFCMRNMLYICGVLKLAELDSNILNGLGLNYHFAKAIENCFHTTITPIREKNGRIE